MKPNQAATTTTSRFDTIDVLRGLSIVAVVLLHTWLRFHFAGYDIGSALPHWFAGFLFSNGGNGVTVFFAVSGFLITTTSLRRFGSLADMKPGTFYRIRFARIAPLLLLVLVVLSTLHLWNASGFHINPRQATLPRALFAALTFHLNWLEAAHGYLPANWDVLWSLSVEEMFYLFFPLLCVLLLRFKRTAKTGTGLFAGTLLLFIAMGPFARTIWSIDGIAREKSYLSGMSAIAAGCLAALLTERLQRYRTSPTSGARAADGPSTLYPSTRYTATLIALQIVGTVLITWIAVWPPWHWMRYIGRSGVDDTILAFATCLIMVASVLRNRPGRTWTAPLRWFGRHSYEVYLTHEFIVVWGTALYLKIHRGPLFIWLIAILLSTAALGWAIAHYYSEPLNRAIRRRYPTSHLTCAPRP
ncbi:MAG TPA: acyltransferase [Acidisarcina sp.]